jgi:hypothetical protein
MMDGDNDDDDDGCAPLPARAWASDRGGDRSDLEQAAFRRGGARGSHDEEPGEPASKRLRHGGADGAGAGSEAEATSGPRSYEDCVRFANYQVAAMLHAIGLDAVSENSLFARKFVLTTDYSGMGCPEMASDLILDSGPLPI